MAIITCCECGKAFSDRAAACPSCGCPTEYSIVPETPVTNITCCECGEAFSDKEACCPNCGCPAEFSTAPKTSAPAAEAPAPEPQPEPQEDPVREAPEQPANEPPKEEPKHTANAPVPSSKKETLRRYLGAIVGLERDIYTMDASISELQDSFKQLPEKQKLSLPGKPHKPSAPFYGKTHNFLGVYFKTLFDEIFHGEGIITRLLSAIIWPIRDSFEAIISNHRTKKENRRKKETYELEQIEYAKAVKHYEEVTMVQYQERVQQNNLRHEREVAQINFFNDGLKKQISELQTEREKTAAALKRLYDTGPLYRKYRNIIAVTMFCEYMDSGKRDTLEGINGMYDLFDAEIRAQTIINNISQINTSLQGISYRIGGIADQLTGIQRNQITLHEELAYGNQIASEICRQNKALLEKTSAMIRSNEEAHRLLSSVAASTSAIKFQEEANGRRLNSMDRILETAHRSTPEYHFGG